MRIPSTTVLFATPVLLALQAVALKQCCAPSGKSCWGEPCTTHIDCKYKLANGRVSGWNTDVCFEVDGNLATVPVVGPHRGRHVKVRTFYKEKDYRGEAQARALGYEDLENWMRSDPGAHAGSGQTAQAQPQTDQIAEARRLADYHSQGLAEARTQYLRSQSGTGPGNTG